MLLCKTRYEGTISLKEIKNDYILKDINVKYHFIIKPLKINENITVINSNFRNPIYSIYPNILIFTSKDLFYIDLLAEKVNLFTGISFNEDKKELYYEKMMDIIILYI